MTPDNYQNTGKLERMLDGIQRKVGDIWSSVRTLSEQVTDIASTTDAIHDAVAYECAAPYSPGHDDFLNGVDE
jgi:hypothetical protein